MAAARACIVALALVAALFVAGSAAAAAGNAGGRPQLSLRQRRRQLLRQRQVRSHLKRLNKAPLATIESPDGDIIDCVHISNQPALDHPFLKNHTVQMRPAYHPEGLYDDESKVASQRNAQTITQMWHQNGRCPEGTIPIRRTKEEDVLRASSVRRYGKKKRRSAPNPMSVDPDMLNESGHQHAIAYVEGDKYYGAKATINVWQPKIEQANEFSLSQLWILGGSFGQDLNSIEAGWQVRKEGGEGYSSIQCKLPFLFIFFHACSNNFSSACASIIPLLSPVLCACCNNDTRAADGGRAISKRS
uniref:Neprosin PEP catalytic domain-containing protein n=1 Tax=Zea mays TaxID=4577 RepID=A0A804QFL5_MAIZE